MRLFLNMICWGGRRFSWHGVLLDCFCMIAIAVVAFNFSLPVFRHNLLSNTNRYWYQKYAGPAVSYALGEGYCQRSLPPNLRKFLWDDWQKNTQRVFSIEDMAGSKKVESLYGISSSARYLFFSLGLWWRLSGEISWLNTAGLLALGYAFALVSVYLLLRVIGGYVPALCGVWWLGYSSLLVHAMNYRDFMIAPFCISLMALLIWLLKRDASIKRLLFFSVASALVCAIGLGFRNDVFPYIPLCILVIAICKSVFLGGWKKTVLLKISAILLFLMSLNIASLPLPTLKSGNKHAANVHIVYLGLSRNHNAFLKLDSSGYFWSLYTNDDHNVTLTSAADTAHGNPAPIRLYSVEERDSLVRRLKELIRYFPSDFFTRGIAASRILINSAFSQHDITEKKSDMAQKTKQFASCVYGWELFKYKLFGSGFNIGVWSAVFLLAGIGYFSMRRSITYLGVFTYLLFYTILQFQERHVFYFSALSVGIILAAFLLACRFGKTIYCHYHVLVRRRKFIGRHLAIVLLCFLLLAVMIWSFWTGMRKYQAFSLEELIYNDLMMRKNIPLEYEITRSRNCYTLSGKDLNIASDSAYKDIPSLRYFRIDFWGKHVERPSMVVVRIKGRVFSSLWRIPLSPGKNHTLLFPVYYNKKFNDFLGMDLYNLPGLDAFSLSEIDETKTIPGFWYFSVPENRKEMNFFQTIKIDK